MVKVADVIALEKRDIVLTQVVAHWGINIAVRAGYRVSHSFQHHRQSRHGRTAGGNEVDGFGIFGDHVLCGIHGASCYLFLIAAQ